MKDKAIKERSFGLIKESKEKAPKSMFGSLKSKTKPFTKKERERLWKDSERDF